MEVQPVVVVGAGGFGREVLDVLEALNETSFRSKFEILGVADDLPTSDALTRLAQRGYRYLGCSVPWLGDHPGIGYIVAIGNPAVRKRICLLIESSTALEPLTIVHPSAAVGSEVRLGKGSVVCAGARISTNVAIGKHVHVNAGAIIGHDALLQDYVSINPGAIISGNVNVGESSLVGAGAVVLQGLIIGEGSTVGAGAVVTRNVLENSVVKGVPAR